MLLGLITQEQPGKFLPDDRDRIAVYLPMSYQIGGYTLFLPRDRVQEMPDMSVEDLMKLTLTAGIGTAAHPAAQRPDAAHTEPPSTAGEPTDGDS